MPAKEVYQKRKNQGLCTGCGGPRDSITLKCKLCREEVSENQKKLIQKRRDTGLCVICGEIALDKKSIVVKRNHQFFLAWIILTMTGWKIGSYMEVGISFTLC